MVLPSALKRGSDSTPGGLASGVAWPPSRGTSHRSSAYTKAMCVALTSGKRSMPPCGRTPLEASCARALDEGVAGALADGELDGAPGSDEAQAESGNDTSRERPDRARRQVDIRAA